jgi:hypothetical protein
VASFTTYAEILTADHAQAKLYEVGTLKRPPGVVLDDILRRNGGAYETTVHLSPKFREEIREVAELTSDEQLRRIADLSEVPVSLEHLRHLDPQTRIVLGAGLDVTPQESERLGRPRLELPPDPKTTVLVEGMTTAEVPMGAIAPSGLRPARTLNDPEPEQPESGPS